ncbi:MAG: response regulator [Patescibacteria group bacterium]
MKLEEKTILIIEDEQDLADTYKLKLKNAGYNVIIAADGLKALAAVKENKQIDLILLDLILPQRSGFSLLKDFKENPESEKIPIFILSNLSLEKEIDQGLKLKADKYLIKTDYTPEKIVNLVNEYFAGK